MSADVALVTLSLAGDAEAQRQLAMRVLDVVHRVVAGRLPTEPDAIPIRVQEVFVALLERDAEELRRWDPDDGVTLEACIARLAQRRIAIIVGDRGGAAPLPGNEPPKWTPLQGEQRESVLAKILARLDHGETLAEVGDELRERDLEDAADLPTRPGLERAHVDDRSAPLRFTVLQVGITVALAIAIASAVAMWAG